MKLQTTIIAAALVLASCGGNQHQADDPLADSGRTQRTENLLHNLKALGDSAVYLFGHHDDTVCGIGWEADYTADSTVHQRSDVKSVCNDFPALLGFDLSGLERGDTVNLDGIPFSRIRQEVIAHYDKGGMVTLSWHLDSPLQEPWLDSVADFLNSLKTPYGVRVPVLFRPCFGRLAPEQYKAQWQTTVDRLKAQDVVNALYAYTPSTDPDGDEANYMACYPGDDIIDLLGLDSYCIAPDADTTQIARYAAQLDKNLAMICQLAKQRQKAAALTETGYDALKTPDWWTHTLAPVLAKHTVCYVLVGRNAHYTHFFAPYPGQQSTSDFIRFYNDKRTLFLSDLNGLYL
jgi:mannan endo-1,4-beta-mannosidase